MAIELLLITFFFFYMRPLIEQGKLYRAVTPLYIAQEKDKELYFYSDEELKEYQKLGRKYELHRNKGLGSLPADILQNVCFKNQNFKRITISDSEEAEKLLTVLMGKDVAPRKKFIYENAEKLGFNFV